MIGDKQKISEKNWDQQGKGFKTNLEITNAHHEKFVDTQKLYTVLWTVYVHCVHTVEEIWGQSKSIRKQFRIT